jgi:arylsulfatase A-like enzyme
MNFLRRIGLLLSLVASVVFAVAQSLAADRPNIILILCDDMGYSDLGCYGSEIRTPNLDRMATEGLRFTQFYNCAVCVTTRAALTTGLYPRKAWGTFREDMVTLGEVMQTAGYSTGYTGKWHLGGTAPKRPNDRGFEEFYGLLSGCANFFNPGKPDPDFYNGGKIRPFEHNGTKITNFPSGYHMTEAFTDHAIRTMDRFTKRDNPFFIHLCYTAPHFPMHAWERDIKRYRGKYEAGYFRLREQRHERQRRLGLLDPKWNLSPVDHNTGDFRYDYDIAPWENLTDRKREEERMEVYAAMVDHLDQNVGRLLSAVDRLGIADNTVIVFLSDNGGCSSWPTEQKEPGFNAYNRGVPVGDPRGYEFCGKGWGWAQNAPFRRHKVWTYEGGIATPCIVRWPGKVKANTITHQPGHVVDFMPTLVELAGAEYPERFKGNKITIMEGSSLLPIFNGGDRPQPDLYWALMGNRAIRQGPWKLVWGASDKRWELYNLADDRTETRDLAKAFPQRVDSMTTHWENWARRTEISF